MQTYGLPFHGCKSAGFIREQLRSHHDTAAKQLTSFKCQVAELKAQIISLAKQLPEYDTVIDIYGVGKISAAQLMDEIGDVRRFHSRSALVGFAGVDPIVNESGKGFKVSSNRQTRLSTPQKNADPGA